MYVSSAPCLLPVVSIIVTSQRLRRYIQIIPLLVLMSSVIRSTLCWSCYDLLIQHVNDFNSSNYHNTSTITVASINVSILLMWSWHWTYTDFRFYALPCSTDTCLMSSPWLNVSNRDVNLKFKFNRESGSSDVHTRKRKRPSIFLVVKRDTHIYYTHEEFNLHAPQYQRDFACLHFLKEWRITKSERYINTITSHRAQGAQLQLIMRHKKTLLLLAEVDE